MKALCIMYSTWDLKKKESQKVKISLTLFCTINIQYYLDKTRKTYCTVDMKIYTILNAFVYKPYESEFAIQAIPNWCVYTAKLANGFWFKFDPCAL